MPDPPRRRGWLWGLGGAGACAVAAVAVVMIVSGWGYTPGPAPMPAKDFSVAASQVPDPVTGPPPEVGAPPQPRSAPSVMSPGAGESSRRPDSTTTGSVDGLGAVDSVASADGADHASDAHTGTAIARRQVPTRALTDDTLVIPALDVNAPVGTSSIVDGELVLPDDVQRTTEWSGSAPIASDRGTILVAGHVNNVDQGEGALWRLHLIHPGDAVYLVKDNTVTRWKITAITAVVKSALPQSLFAGDHGPRLLKLVTCGGKLEHTPDGLGYYQDNVIATAVPF